VFIAIIEHHLPGILRLALDPGKMSRKLRDLTLDTVDPAICAYVLTGAVKAMPASIRI
jgi:hypothetical protein